MRYLLFLLIIYSILNAKEYTFKDKTLYLEKIKEDIYIDENNKEVKLKNNFFVKVKSNTDIKDILNSYNLAIIKEYSKQLYLVESENTDILDLIQQIDNDLTAVYAYPNFYKKLEVR